MTEYNATAHARQMERLAHEAAEQWLASLTPERAAECIADIIPISADVELAYEAREVIAHHAPHWLDKGDSVAEMTRKARADVWRVEAHEAWRGNGLSEQTASKRALVHSYHALTNPDEFFETVEKPVAAITVVPDDASSIIAERLAGLTERQRGVFELAYGRGLLDAAIAAELGISAQAVYKHRIKAAAAVGALPVDEFDPERRTRQAVAA